MCFLSNFIWSSIAMNLFIFLTTFSFSSSRPFSFNSSEDYIFKSFSPPKFKLFMCSFSLISISSCYSAFWWIFSLFLMTSFFRCRFYWNSDYWSWTEYLRCSFSFTVTSIIIIIINEKIIIYLFLYGLIIIKI